MNPMVNHFGLAKLLKLCPHLDLPSYRQIFFQKKCHKWVKNVNSRGVFHPLTTFYLKTNIFPYSQDQDLGVGKMSPIQLDRGLFCIRWNKRVQCNGQPTALLISLISGLISLISGLISGQLSV